MSLIPHSRFWNAVRHLRYRIAACSLLALLLANSWASRAAWAETLLESSMADGIDVQKFNSMHPGSRPMKIGLALGGGGARGAAIVGVLEVLEKEGVKIDYITGTSIGAVVGGLYAAGVPLSTIHRDFESGAIMHHFMTVSLPVRLLAAPILYMPRLIGARPYDGLYRGNKFRKYLEKILPEDRRKIEQLQIPFAAVSLNLIDGKPYMIRSGDLGYAMQASSAVPSLRKPVEIDGKLFVDGGVACNLPVKQCRELGADFVIAVDIDQPFKQVPLKVFRAPGSVAKRMITWDLWASDQAQGQLADLVIHPDTDGVSLLETSKKAAKHLLETGTQAGREALPQLKEKLQGLAKAE